MAMMTAVKVVAATAAILPESFVGAGVGVIVVVAFVTTAVATVGAAIVVAPGIVAAFADAVLAMVVARVAVLLVAACTLLRAVALAYVVPVPQFAEHVTIAVLKATATRLPLLAVSVTPAFITHVYVVPFHEPAPVAPAYAQYAAVKFWFVSVL